MNNLSLKSRNIELVGLGITMASRSVSKFFNKSLRKYGITMNQVYVMYAIAEYRGYNIGYIAKKLLIEHCALKQCMESIEKYVKIYKDPQDKRAYCPALTQEGSEFLKKIMPKMLELEEAIGLLTKDKDFFIDFVNKFSTDMARSTLKLKREKESEE